MSVSPANPQGIHPPAQAAPDGTKRSLVAFFVAAFLADALLLIYDVQTEAHSFYPRTMGTHVLRLLIHGFFDALAVSILYFGIRSRARTGPLEMRSWFVAAGAGVVFALLLYGPELVHFQQAKVTNPGNLEGPAQGRGFPILIYFLLPLVAALVTTTRRKA